MSNGKKIYVELTSRKLHKHAHIYEETEGDLTEPACEGNNY